ncbi:MAG: hypothetical protein H6700_11875 [Myxococcales bacterium]|nr:hypothetical protein [Myxococcales bacterium]MCB9521044.1 hypothetical protein [Myxococcales bacterium]MCB9532454.1 hypothetical protein [Myxococcales bacterium]
MEFFTDIVTRGYEADASRRVPLPTLFQYLEHLRWCCIIDPRSGLGDAVDHGHFFVVHRQSMTVARAVGQDTPLRIYLWTERVGRSAIDIGHEIRRTTDGAVVATAQVTGLWLGPNRRLCRIPDRLREFAESVRPPPPPAAESALEDHSSRFESSYIRPPEIRYPASAAALPEFAEAVPDRAFRATTVIRPSDLDIFAHVNAATYLRLCDDTRIAAAGHFGIDTRRPAIRAAIRYDRETTEGEPLDVFVWMLDATHVAYSLRVDGDPRAAAVMEIAPRLALPGGPESP